ncbi:MAG: hypothetical protein ABEJ03_06215 [Candidatus Nanohaloarchaea archaeon]
MDLNEALEKILTADESAINELPDSPGKSEIKKLRREAEIA